MKSVLMLVLIAIVQTAAFAGAKVLPNDISYGGTSVVDIPAYASVEEAQLTETQQIIQKNPQPYNFSSNDVKGQVIPQTVVEQIGNIKVYTFVVL
jgi:hypothetical protein